MSVIELNGLEHNECDQLEKMKKIVDDFDLNSLAIQIDAGVKLTVVEQRIAKMSVCRYRPREVVRPLLRDIKSKPPEQCADWLG